jgi:hypothetical protein
MAVQPNNSFKPNMLRSTNMAKRACHVCSTTQVGLIQVLGRMPATSYLPNSGEFSDMDTWDRCYWLSRAYLEASVCLCEAMVKEDFTNQYSSSRVIIHLARQGLELFLKGSILVATGTNSLLGHNLAKLLTQYREHYRDDSYHFKSPRHFALGGSEDLFQEELDNFHSTLDQRHRYPADRKGQYFAAPEVFDPKEFLRDVRDLDKQLKVIEFLHIRPGLKCNAP